MERGAQERGAQTAASVWNTTKRQSFPRVVSSIKKIGRPVGARNRYRSGASKLYPHLDLESPHDRQQARKQDPDIVEALAQVESVVPRTNTNVKYKGQWEYLAHCEDFGEGLFQSGKQCSQFHFGTLVTPREKPS